MMLTALTLLLLSAEPGPAAPPAPPSSESSLVVVSTAAAPALEKVATEAGRKLGLELETSFVDLGGYLKSRSEGCEKDPRCLLAAPGLSGASRLLHLRLSPLSSGRISVELRLVDLRTRKVLGRSASVVEPGELATWGQRASSRLLTRADPYALEPPPSPFAVQPPAEPAATPRPAADAPRR
jgi:hypothetical protein